MFLWEKIENDRVTVSDTETHRKRDKAVKRDRNQELDRCKADVLEEKIKTHKDTAAERVFFSKF